MALFSFTGEGSQTLEQLLQKKRGEPSVSVDGVPVRKGVEGELDAILGFMKASGVNNLEEAVRLVNEKGIIKGDYATYAGRMLHRVRTDKEAMDMGLPSRKVLEAMGGRDSWALGEFSGVGNRIARGGQKELNQILYGIGNWSRGLDKSIHEATGGMIGRSEEEFKQVQADRKQAVGDFKFDEAIWKSYNANPDSENESGLDMPWNVGGTIGEMIPGMVAGGITALPIKGVMQPATAFGSNAALEGAKYEEHGDKVEAGIGIGAGLLEFIPGVGPYLKSLNPVRKGQMIKNWATFAGSGTKKGLGKNAADRGFNAWKMVNERNLSAPYSMARNPKKVVDKLGSETRLTPIIQMKKEMADIEGRGALAYRQALENIGYSKEQMKKTVPAEAQATPYGYGIREKVNEQKAKFQELAKPHREAYRKAGDSLQLNTKEMVDMAQNGLTDPSALAHLNRSIRGVTKRESPYSIATKARLDELSRQKLGLNESINKLSDSLPLAKEQLAQLVSERKLIADKIASLPEEATQLTRDGLTNQLSAKDLQTKKLKQKITSGDKKLSGDIASRNAGDFEYGELIKSEGMLDLDNLTANQLDDVIMNINQELKGSGQMMGAMSPTVEKQLKGWAKQAREKLGNLDPEFSVPYGKTKAIDKASIDLFSDDAGPVKGLATALDDKTNTKLEGLFTGKGGMDNLQGLGQIMDSSNPTYRGLVRKNIEDQIDPSVLKQGNYDYPVGFDFTKFANNTRSVDWDDYRKLLPDGESEGVDFLSGLSGFDDTVMKGNMDKIATALGNTKDVDTLKDTPIRDTFDQLRVFVQGKDKPYYRYTGNYPTIRERIETEMAKAEAPEKVGPLLRSPGAQMDEFIIPYMGGRKLDTGSDLVVPVKQNEQGVYDVLNNPDFK